MYSSLFIQHTELSELAKRVREKIESFKSLSSIRLKIVERTGETLEEILHKSNPWEKIDCGRDDCGICGQEEGKMDGKCKRRSVVYETQCGTCEVNSEEMNDKETQQLENERENGELENNME